ncbi:MAG: Rrf2 family transcriptional regulator [Peptoniphilaceae bacterium]|nr:Rrf2 family transcriptional regulator [Peptoniphilaceae bacterium]MCI6659682.1 Rrf2 family transcriptional regulator [Peptoniphilaceae bacterium]MDD7433617.1 Rrf2 family transcriptional regulator [Peptoniphilaceae bacterium]MDY3076082.1 Rrf2 family transcriptional regulator [Peptoniphilaceae bacterium]MDY4196904.1 Rrf2 family transcriptional regulator [Peptoniphilaceae bacterium]
MKLTTRSRYGLRAIVYVASQPKDSIVSITEISQELLLSESYLEQLFRLLRKDGFLKSIRGVNGGYVLAKPADQISVLELLNTLEGDFWLADCVVAGDCPGGRTNCATRYIMSKINEAIYSSVKDIYLSDLVERESSI